MPSPLLRLYKSALNNNRYDRINCYLIHYIHNFQLNKIKNFNVQLIITNIQKGGTVLASKQLHHIVEITKHCSLPTLAWNLHMAQFTINQPIANLEKELRLKIFNRSQTHGAVPTGEDRIILISYL